MKPILELFNNYEQILNRNFSAKDIRVPYRNINHWDEKGLLLNTKRGDGQWRKFNFMDCMWVRIISELRKFGVSFALIKLLKEIGEHKVEISSDENDSVVLQAKVGKSELYFESTDLLLIPLAYKLWNHFFVIKETTVSVIKKK